MKIDLGGGELCLAENRPLRLQAARGLCIRCTAGMVWITVAGEPADVFLGAGDSYRIPGDGDVLVEGVGSGRIMVNPETAGRRLRLCFSGWLSARLAAFFAPRASARLPAR